MKKFNVKPLGAIISGLIMAAATQSALAQEADAAQDEPVVEEITVTGFAKSIATAIEMKRNADTVVEAISSEDISGLPDKSIADSLSRLPGITVTRKGGQAGTVQVRGMGEGYVLSTMNGREQVSPNGSRAMEYSQFPSELISSVEVYKSPKASLIEGGTAGTIELKTVNPLDLKEERQFNVGFRGTYNDQASNLYDADAEGHRISLSYQQKLLDDTLGFSLGYAQLKEPRSQLQVDISSYDSRVPNATPAGDAWTTTNIKILQDSGVTKRDGYMGAIQYSPTEELSVQADAFYSKFEIDSNSRGIWAQGINNATRSSIGYFNNTVETSANVSNTTATGAFGIATVNDNKDNENKLFSSGIKLEWKRDALSVGVDVSHSDASGYEVNGNGIVEQYKTSATNASGYVLEMGEQQLHYQLDGLNVPSIAVTSDLTDLNKLRVTSQASYPYVNEDKIDAVRIDVKYELELPVLSSVEAGVRTSKRNHQESRELNRYGNAGISTDYSLEVTEANADLVNWKGAFSNMPSFYAVDTDAILANAYAEGKVLMSGKSPYAYDAQGKLLPRSSGLAWRWGNGEVIDGVPNSGTAWSLQQGADIDENVDSIYIQANISTTIADRDLTGNIGLRHIRTEQSNYSLADLRGDKANGAIEICDVDGVCLSRYGYTKVGTEYSNTLPSLNLKYQLTDIDQVRFALARVMSRAPIRQLASFAFGRIDVIAGVPTYNYGEGKSPLLKPFLADQIDLSYEHYLEETNGSITVAAFYRKIKSFVQTQTIANYDFDSSTFDDKPDIYVVNDRTTGFYPTERTVVNGTYTFASNNQEGGFIKGIEFTYTQTFTFLPGYWSGLGFNGSASFTDSEISQPRTGAAVYDSSPMDFPGLVKKSANFTLFYTYEGFETRLSTTFQDSFVGESRTIGPDVVPVSYAAETVLDYQAKYKTENGLELIFSVGNVTNEPNRSFMIDEALPLKLNWFGRTYALGANYTF